jgi:hypothetical protein
MLDRRLSDQTAQSRELTSPDWKLESMVCTCGEGADAGSQKTVRGDGPLSPRVKKTVVQSCQTPKRPLEHEQKSFGVSAPFRSNYVMNKEEPPQIT